MGHIVGNYRAIQGQMKMNPGAITTNICVDLKMNSDVI